MRIISGTHKGRRIAAPKNLPVRPTTDRSKEGLFNILQHRLEFDTLSVLDLFSGTGNMSYEFASRGVSNITSVDQNRNCIHFIQKTATELSLNINSIQSESTLFLKKNLQDYSLIFADPPYNIYDVNLFVKNALTKVNKGGFLVVECSAKESLEGYDKIAKFGETNLVYWKV